MDAVLTEPIYLTGITKDTTKEVALQLKEGIVASRKDRHGQDYSWARAVTA